MDEDDLSVVTMRCNHADADDHHRYIFASTAEEDRRNGGRLFLHTWAQKWRVVDEELEKETGVVTCALQSVSTGLYLNSYGTLTSADIDGAWERTGDTQATITPTPSGPCTACTSGATRSGGPSRPSCRRKRRPLAGPRGRRRKRTTTTTGFLPNRATRANADDGRKSVARGRGPRAPIAVEGRLRGAGSKG